MIPRDPKLLRQEIGAAYFTPIQARDRSSGILTALYYNIERCISRSRWADKRYRLLDKRDRFTGQEVSISLLD